VGTDHPQTPSNEYNPKILAAGGERDGSFGRLLRSHRGALGLTQEELAERSGVSVKAISMLERGVRTAPRASTVEFLAAALRLDSSEHRAFTAAGQGTVVRSRREPDAGGDVDEPADLGTATAAATRTLPRAVTSFTGRQEELDRLVGAISGPARSGLAVGISTIDGMAGVGKTAFAVRAAHELAPQFPDGQLFLDLHAHTEVQRPVEPADALRSLLLTIGVAAQLIPPDLDARAALWRDRLDGKRMLILLDDAASHDQVGPLVPAGPGSLVLITSRRRLTALEDVEPLTLGTLPPVEAAALFTRLGGARARDEPAIVARLVELCGYLPLAIGLLAGQLRSHPAWTVGYLSDRFRDAVNPLTELHAEDVAVGAAFDLSYRNLSGEQQRVFRRLGLHPGLEIDAYGAAALADLDLPSARRQLEALYTDHLLDEPVAGRYRLHDLMRAHARALALQDDAAGSEAAVGRLIAFYLDATTDAVQHIARRSDAITAPAAGAPTGRPRFASPRGALAWLEMEWPNLAVSCGHAVHARRGPFVQLGHAMHPFLRSAGHWDQALAIHRSALTAARDIGDRLGQACALHDLGVVQRIGGDYSTAAVSLAGALVAYREAGDRAGIANTLNDLATLQRMTGEYDAAGASLVEAMTIFGELGSLVGRAYSLVEYGNVQRLTGSYEAAATSLTESLSLHRQVGDKRGQGDALHYLGSLQCEIGQYSDATASLSDALAICRDLGDRSGQASTLNNLGIAQYRTGRYPDATRSLMEALTLFRELGSRNGQAAALDGLGHVHRITGDHPAAISALMEALGLFRELGNELGQADVLNEIGTAQGLTGAHSEATASLTEAFDIHERTGNQRGRAETLNRFGALMLDASRHEKALDHYAQALCLARDGGIALEEARALEGIGRSLVRTHHTGEGSAHLRHALAIYRRLGVPEQGRIEGILAELGDEQAARAPRHESGEEAG
jgi:tetratricopeptide (TPR) repeat protein/transcriptional regulator with XRE-family HTH domain